MIWIHSAEIIPVSSKKETARKLSQAAKKLCSEMVLSFSTHPPCIEYAPSGKPFLSSHPDITFNLSHSGQLCVCALLHANSPDKIGIDIEQIVPDSPRLQQIAKRVFHPDEFSYYEQNHYAPASFYRIWTRKESYLKCLGTGLAGGLKSTNTFANLVVQNTPYRFHESIIYDQNGHAYALSLCLPNHECVSFFTSDHT